MQTELPDSIETAQRAFDNAKANTDKVAKAREYLVELEKGLGWVSREYRDVHPSAGFGPSANLELVNIRQKDEEEWINRIHEEQSRVKEFLSHTSDET